MNYPMDLSNKDLVEDRLIQEIANSTQDQIEKLLMLLIDWRNDKRNHAREVQHLMDVTYWDDEKQLNGFIKDLSPGGVFIKQEGPFSIGQHITMKFYHKSVAGPIQIDGEIVRRVKRGVGVKFAREIIELA